MSLFKERQSLKIGVGSCDKTMNGFVRNFDIHLVQEMNCFESRNAKKWVSALFS